MSEEETREVAGFYENGTAHYVGEVFGPVAGDAQAEALVETVKSALTRAASDFEFREGRQAWVDDALAALSLMAVRLERLEDERLGVALAGLEAANVLRSERDEAREIVEHLRRHGADWIVEKANERIAAAERERDAARQEAEDYGEALQQIMGVRADPTDRAEHLLTLFAEVSRIATNATLTGVIAPDLRARLAAAEARLAVARQLIAHIDAVAEMEPAHCAPKIRRAIAARAVLVGGDAAP